MKKVNFNKKDTFFEEDDYNRKNKWNMSKDPIKRWKQFSAVLLMKFQIQNNFKKFKMI